MTPLPSTEARAKRTHARRSCDVCKVRKTRCELPDLDVPSGPDPLPLDKSCHRCKVLALPCIVDDSAKKQRKRSREDGSSTKPNGSIPDLASAEASRASTASPKRRAIKLKRKTPTDVSSIAPSRVASVNHTLNLMHGLAPTDNDNQTQPTETLQPIRHEPHNIGLTVDTMKTRSLKLHTRPAELTCAMLRVAYSKSDKRRKRGVADDDEVDLNELLDDQLVARLQPGFAQLQVYHPHLEPIPVMLDMYNSSPEPTLSLLIAMVVYISTIALPADATTQNIRKVLTPFITGRRNDLLLQLPNTFFALASLELLATHSPFGVLPLQMTNLHTLAVAKGYVPTASLISTRLSFVHMIEKLVTGPRIGYAFKCSDTWLWLSLIATEAAATLEDNDPIKPLHLAQARQLADTFCDMSVHGDLWQDSIGREDASVLVGRLAVSDKLARLEELLDALARVRESLETSSRDPMYDPVRGITMEFEAYTRKIDELGRRHDFIMRLLRDQSRGVESGWLAYRAIRLRYEISKLHGCGILRLMAVHFLPGSPYAFPGLPPFLTPEQSAAYAVSRAYNPPDITRLITDNSRTGKSAEAMRTVWDYGLRRGGNLQENLAACAELGRSLVADLNGHVYASIVPLHDVICIAVEAAKVLMEMEAGTIQVLRSTDQTYKAFREKPWLEVMGQMTESMQAIGMLAPEDELGGESITNGCSNLIGSMVRTAREWTEWLEKEQAAYNLAPATSLDVPGTSPPPRQPFANGNAPAAYETHRQPGVTTHQQYMDTSDRWMASNETMQMSGQNGPPPPPTLSHVHDAQYQQHPQQQHLVHGPVGSSYPPGASLDQLLSEIFCYSYPAQGHLAAQHHHPPTHTPMPTQEVASRQGEASSWAQ
ncbi:hypothetical protein CI109_104671 [Kwoniella shandongensis]|uniref:Uncharacterized protein n=1 Tax=Kwoniella shandongensis TaxID=1734106 RepID=A0A5M6BVF0_9TREE|nr:uncharacterized protein CI109_004836 [Kwoniella shandongensis]KAA5526836.1 hypothetical protein CI109_004836 [Kwoniella shandongensis]